MSGNCPSMTLTGQEVNIVDQGYLHQNFENLSLLYAHFILQHYLFANEVVFSYTASWPNLRQFNPRCKSGRKKY